MRRRKTFLGGAQETALEHQIRDWPASRQAVGSTGLVPTPSLGKAGASEIQARLGESGFLGFLVSWAMEASQGLAEVGTLSPQLAESYLRYAWVPGRV